MTGAWREMFYKLGQTLDLEVCLLTGGKLISKYLLDPPIRKPSFDEYWAFVLGEKW